MDRAVRDAAVPGRGHDRGGRALERVDAVGYVEWHHFVMEYPQLADREREFTDRLIRAVTPTFDGQE